MSFWKNLLGISKKETQIIEEPEHDLANRPPDDLMVVKDEIKEAENNQAESNNLDNKDKDLSNKDSH